MHKRLRGRPSHSARSHSEAGSQAREQRQHKSQHSYFSRPAHLEDNAPAQALHDPLSVRTKTPSGQSLLKHNTATTAAASPLLPAAAGPLPSPSVAIPPHPLTMPSASTLQGGGGRKRQVINNTSPRSPATKKLKTEGEVAQQNSYTQSPSPSRHVYPEHSTISGPAATNTIAALEPPVDTGPASFPTINPQGNGKPTRSPIIQHAPNLYSNPATTVQIPGSSPIQTTLPHGDLPPKARIRKDGKGRDPYNIETICQALNIPMNIWDTRLRPELAKVIAKYGLTSQKVIPSNAHARDQAVDEWIRQCPEWMNEPNENYRKIYAMDRLKCGMADIRRSKSQGHRNRRKKGGDHARQESEAVARGDRTSSEPAASLSAADTTPTMHPQGQPPNPPPRPVSRGGPEIDSPHERPHSQPYPTVGPHDHYTPHPRPISADPPMSLESSEPRPGEYVVGPPISITELSPTIVASSMGRRMMLTSTDFMLNGEYQLANVQQFVMEDIGLSLHDWALSYRGPHGKIFISNNRSLRNAVIYEAGRGQKYPIWELEPRPPQGNYFVQNNPPVQD